VMTAAMPMMIPSMVRNARILLAKIAPNATRRISKKSMAASSAPARPGEGTAVPLPQPVEELLLLLLQARDRDQDDLLAGLEPVDDFRVIPIVESEDHGPWFGAGGRPYEDDAGPDVAGPGRTEPAARSAAGPAAHAGPAPGPAAGPAARPGPAGPPACGPGTARAALPCVALGRLGVAALGLARIAGLGPAAALERATHRVLAEPEDRAGRHGVAHRDDRGVRDGDRVVAARDLDADLGVHPRLQQAFAVVEPDQDGEHRDVLFDDGLRLDLEDFAGEDPAGERLDGDLCGE